MHYIHIIKIKKIVVGFKIGLEKEYDRVNWSFLETTLHDFRFPTFIIRLIMNCVKLFFLSLLWNDSKLDPFVSLRGFC